MFWFFIFGGVSGGPNKKPQKPYNQRKSFTIGCCAVFPEAPPCTELALRWGTPPIKQNQCKTTTLQP
eukprot:1180787-Amphidinium_carterae.1